MRSYLVVGNQTLASPELEAAIREQLTSGATDFHVVVPVEPAQKGFTWDEGEAHAAARDRLDAFIHKLEAMGADASGEIGRPRSAVAARILSPSGWQLFLMASAS